MAVADRAPARTRRGVNPRGWIRHASPPALAGSALVAALAYAAFADGSIALPMEARLQVALAAVALFALGAFLFGRGVRASSNGAGWTGLALLLVFAAYCGLSFAWSIAPDGTWGELNRALAYVLVTAAALLVAASLPRALERGAL